MRKNLRIYDSARNYFEGPDDMKNEVMMWFVAGGLLLQALSRKSGNAPFGGLKGKIGYEENAKLRSIEILDLCSGPGNFVNHLAFAYPNIRAVCVDRNDNFIRTGNGAFQKWEFIKGDATEISLHRKFHFVTASSAYHHIEDKNKMDFLKTIRKHLADDGIAIICENFLPDYTPESGRTRSINLYYDELESWYRRGNATNEAIEIIKEVRQQELRGEEEHKVPFRVFENHVRESGLKIDTDIAVWQTRPLMPDNAGSHVITLRK